MKNLAILVLILIVLSVIALMFICFQVRETEYALVMRFGESVRQYVKPGLKFRWPLPIETVHKFDSRMRVFEAEVGETTTKGAIPLVVNTFVIWRIEDPLKFHIAVGTVDQAESKLRSQISDTQNKVVGLHEFGEFVNSDPTKIKFEQIQKKMLADIAPSVLANYGIKIETVGIRQLKVSEDTTENVFARMRAERETKIQALESQGKAEALRITSDADSKKTEILATAEARAKAIRGQGEAEAAKYLAYLEKDPEFANFLENIEALKEILKKRSTYISSGDDEPFNLLKGVPSLEPAK